MNRATLSVIGCSLVVFWSGFMAFGYPAIMSTYWQQQFNVGSTETGAVITCMLFALAMSMFFCGKIHIRIGMKKCVIIGVGLMIIAMGAQMIIPEMLGVYVWAVISNTGLSFIYGPGLTTAQQWFPHRRGLASGAVNFAFGVAAAALSPVWNRVLDSVGSSKMNLMLVACMLAIGVVSYLMVSEPPASNITASGLRNYTVKEALCMKPFWIIWFCWIFVGAAGISMVSLGKSYSLSLGLSAVAVLTAFNLANGFGRIVAASLGEIIGGERTGALIFGLSAIGYAVLPHTNSEAVIMIMAAFIGMSFGTLFTVTSPLASGIFGLKNFGMIYGLIFTAYGFIGGVLGPAVGGMVLDKTDGNYMIVFTYLAAFSLIGAVLMIVLKRNCDKIK